MITIADGQVQSKSRVFAICGNWQGYYLTEGHIRKTWNGFKVGSSFVSAKDVEKNVYSRKKAAELTMKLMKAEEPKEEDLLSFSRGIGRSGFYGLSGRFGNGAMSQVSLETFSQVFGRQNGRSSILWDQLAVYFDRDILSTYSMKTNLFIDRLLTETKGIFSTNSIIPIEYPKVQNKLDDIVEEYIDKGMRFTTDIDVIAKLIRIQKVEIPMPKRSIRYHNYFYYNPADQLKPYMKNDVDVTWRDKKKKYSFQ